MSTKEILKELKKKSFNMIVLIITGLMILNFSFFSFFILDEDYERLVWTLDLALFNFIVSTILTLIFWGINSYRTEVIMSVKNSREKSDKITIIKGYENKIQCELSLRGKSKYLNRDTSISFPDWISPQVNASPYITVNRRINGFDIDIEKMLNDQNEVTINDHININLTSNTPLYKSAEVRLQWKRRFIYERLFIKIKSIGITVINQEE